MLKFCPVKGCWHLQTVKVEYNNVTKFCCPDHIEDTEREIAEEFSQKKEDTNA